MKKSTINKVFIATIILMVCFMSCKDDKPTGKGDASIISVTNVGDSNIVSVSAFIWNEANDCYQDLDMIATCKYKNNGFNLVLPAVLDGKYLEECFKSENVRGAELTCILGFDKDGEAIGEFVLEDETIDGEAFYVYVDRNFTDNLKSAIEFSKYWIFGNSQCF